MATPIDIIGGFYTVDGRSWAAQDCVNYLPMAAEVSGTKTQTSLRTPPGLRPYVEIGDGPEYAIRGGHDVEGRRFVVAGQRLYQISNTGIAIPLGTVPGVGRVSMAHNQIAGGNELLVVNGNAGYVWNTLKQTFTRVTDPGYPGAFLADFVDSYLMQVEPFGRYLFHSDLANASEYNTLDRFEAEAEPDRIVSMLVDHGEVWAFGVRTIQLFQNTGAAQGTFQPKGITIEQGCAGRFTPAKLDNSVFWLGNDGIFYRADGYSPMRISTHAIEDAIADCDWSQAFAFTWASKGHKVYYCTFPDGQTWGYDVSSRLWHRRASYHPVHEVARRWRLSDLFYSNGEWIGCDSTSGKLFILDWDYMLEDVDHPLVSERVTAIATNAQARFSVDSVEILMRTGEPKSAGGAFPIQPQGPSISGDAPDGSLGMDYAGFQYTIIAGDAPISSVNIVSGALPNGLTMSGNGQISSSAPTKLGSFSFTIRVRDTNGLFTDLEDTIEIGHVAFATTNDLGHLLVSPDGLTWGGMLVHGLSSPVGLLKCAGGRVYVLGGGLGRSSVDYGQTFQNVVFDTGFDTTAAVGIIYVADLDRWVMSFEFGTKVGVSEDGLNFSPVDVGVAPSWYAIAAHQGVVYLGATNGRVVSSADLATWSSTFPAAADVNLIVPSGDDLILISREAYPGTERQFIGKTPLGAWQLRSQPGIDNNTYPLLFSSGDRLIHGYNQFTIWSTDQARTWNVGGQRSSLQISGTQQNNITYNGIRFIAGAGINIEVSDTGDAWAIAYTAGAQQWLVTSSFEYFP